MKRFVRLVVVPAAATLAALALLLVAAEYLLRCRNPGYQEEIAAGYISAIHRHSDVYGWELRRTRIPGEAAVNSQGYRGKEFPHAKGARTRIVVLGDSVAFGYRAPDGEIFSDVLNETRPDLEMVNLAVQGYGTDQMLIKLEREGLRFNPDIVVLMCNLDNDAEDNAKSLYDGSWPKPYFILQDGQLVKYDEHVRLSWPRKAATELSQRSLLYNRLRKALAPKAPEEGEEPETKEPKAPEDRERILQRYDLTFRLIRRMNDLLAERGIKFVVLLMPDKAAFKRERVSQPTDACVTSPVLQTVHLVKMYDLYTQKGVAYSNYYQYATDRYLHLSPEGHRLTARIICEVLRSLGWIAATPSESS